MIPRRILVGRIFDGLTLTPKIGLRCVRVISFFVSIVHHPGISGGSGPALFVFQNLVLKVEKLSIGK